MARKVELDINALVGIARRHNLTYLSLFGSYARNEAGPESDVDLYARFGRPVSLFEVLAVKNEMEDAIGIEVDFIVEEAVILHQFMREGIAQDSVVLIEEEHQGHVIAQ